MSKSVLLVLVGVQLLAGCSDDTKSIVVFDAGALPAGAGATSASIDGSASDAGGAGDASSATSASDCFPAPKTYLELINACTDAEKVDKQPVLPLLGQDGGLPPLP